MCTACQFLARVLIGAGIWYQRIGVLDLHDTQTRNWPNESLVFILPTQYPRRDDQAELAWVTWLNTEMVRLKPCMVTHLSTNPAHRRVTSLMYPTTLPLSSTANTPTWKLWVFRPTKRLKFGRMHFFLPATFHRQHHINTSSQRRKAKLIFLETEIIFSFKLVHQESKEDHIFVTKN